MRQFYLRTDNRTDMGSKEDSLNWKKDNDMNRCNL